MEQLLALPDPPTAVFAASDVQAFGAWAYARDRGIRVPRDVSIVGYDDLKVSRFLDLTTVDQQMQQAGSLATERLLPAPRRRRPRRESRSSSPLALVVRGSTAAADSMHDARFAPAPLRGPHLDLGRATGARCATPTTWATAASSSSRPTASRPSTTCSGRRSRSKGRS